MALELAPKVRVCAVAPGYVLTPMQRAEYTDAMLEEVNQKIPLRRHAKPEEIAALVRLSRIRRRCLRHRPRLHHGRRRNRGRIGQPVSTTVFVGGGRITSALVAGLRRSWTPRSDRRP
jgi:NAD(P)-dependent dehydrogenase (short-subunit alcohol dehydrogenase family)